ncbi:unnamed protein product, partial [Prorocentrum cordatum]
APPQRRAAHGAARGGGAGRAAAGSPADAGAPMAGHLGRAAPPAMAVVHDGVLRGHCVQVVSRTWTRDSSDLFDFETQQLETKTFTVARPSQLVRKGVHVQAYPFASGAHGSEGLITLAQRRDGTFYVDRAGSSSSTKRLWLVVKDLPSCRYALSE